MKTPQVLIITDLDLDFTLLDEIDYELIRACDVTSISQTSCITLNEEYEFDFLIASDKEILNKLNLLKDGSCFITNYYMESSLDGVFIIRENSSNLSFNEQLSQIISYLF